MNSGIVPGSDMIEAYRNIHYKRTEKCWVIAINNSNLEVVFKGDSSFQYKDLVQHLPAKEPRFVIVDFDYETNERPARKTNKLIFISWCPTESPITKKFTYVSAMAGVVNTLGAIQKQIQCDSYDQLDYETIRSSCL